MSSATYEKLRNDYPWTETPLVAGAPMRLIAFAELAVALSKAGGLGFIGVGSDVSILEEQLVKSRNLLSDSSLKTNSDVLPVGVGFLLWGADLQAAVKSIKTHKPCAAWLFAPRELKDLVTWTEQIRTASPNTKIWIQVAGVKEATEVTSACSPDVLVLQGQDAGGHGKFNSSSIMTLVPEVVQNFRATPPAKVPHLIAAGGIITAPGVLAALSLGAQGVVLGTRLLAASEAYLPRGHQLSLLHSSDGGNTTVRTKLYDSLRGTTAWPAEYGGRGIKNQSWTDAEAGMEFEKNKELYVQMEGKGTASAEGWGFDDEGKGSVEKGRLTAYAGTGIGLVNEVKSAAEIVKEIREGVVKEWRELGVKLIGPSY